MFGETNTFYVKIWNDAIATTIYKWMFQVTGATPFLLGHFQQSDFSDLTDHEINPEFRWHILG